MKEDETVEIMPLTSHGTKVVPVKEGTVSKLKKKEAGIL
jgi:hypothetical protein